MVYNSGQICFFASSSLNKRVLQNNSEIVPYLRRITVLYVKVRNLKHPLERRLCVVQA